MQTAKVLAEAVIPNEYGIDPGQKLRIGSKICNALLGKLLADLANMRDESLATAVSALAMLRISGLRLLLGTEAHVMISDGVDFFFFHSNVWHVHIGLCNYHDGNGCMLLLQMILE